jgi:hypothetical protein
MENNPIVLFLLICSVASLLSIISFAVGLVRLFTGRPGNGLAIMLASFVAPIIIGLLIPLLNLHFGD